MYQVNTYYDSNSNVEVPNCMYKVKPYHETSVIHQIKDDSVDPKVREIEAKQDAILKSLEKMTEDVAELKKKYASSTKAATGNKLGNTTGVTDIVIYANPESTPLALLVLYKQLSEQYRVLGVCHSHCSVLGKNGTLKNVFGGAEIDRNRNGYQLVITLIWKKVSQPVLMVNPSVQSAVTGEGNISRYLSRLLDSSYENTDIVTATQVDHYIDLAHQVVHGKDKDRASVLKDLNVRLGKSTWVVGNEMCLADIVLWSALNQAKQVSAAPGNVKKWIEKCNNDPSFIVARSCI